MHCSPLPAPARNSLLFLAFLTATGCADDRGAHPQPLHRVEWRAPSQVQAHIGAGEVPVSLALARPAPCDVVEVTAHAGGVRVGGAELALRDSGAWAEASGRFFLALPEGRVPVELRARCAGKLIARRTVEVVIDRTAPALDAFGWARGAGGKVAVLALAQDELDMGELLGIPELTEDEPAELFLEPVAADAATQTHAIRVQWHTDGQPWQRLEPGEAIVAHRLLARSDRVRIHLSAADPAGNARYRTITLHGPRRGVREAVVEVQ
jgi:hypothetical protein